MSARMSAVIYTDSTFVGAENALAKILFVNQQTAVKKTVENKSNNGLNRNIPKKQ